MGERVGFEKGCKPKLAFWKSSIVNERLGIQSDGVWTSPRTDITKH